MVSNKNIYERYEQERNKRILVDGRLQYQKVEGKFSDFSNAPWIKNINRRNSINIDTQTLIVGGGLGGILAAINLKKQNFDDFIIIDNAEDFGGVWYWNRYPGCSCDVESYIYLPLLEETGYIPSKKYISSSEIATYLRELCRKYNLYEKTYFQTSFTKSVWDEKQSKWNSSTSLDDCIQSKYVILSTGFLSTPKLPGIPGIESFKGKSFHTSRWDYSFTGGNEKGDLHGLKNMNIALIGTGASAVQIAPHLAASAKNLFIFQRTPVAVGGQLNTATDINWYKNQDKGWQKKRSDNFNALMEGIPQDINLVNDEWTDLSKYLDYTNDNIIEAWEDAELKKMNQIRDNIDSKVNNPDVAKKLMPWYKWLCKRPCFHDSYLDIFNKKNVHLIDTDGKGVDKITDNSVVVGDESYPVDCIIYATGYEVGSPYESRCNLKMIGRNGLSLTEKWGNSHMSMHGFMTHDFPNLFLMNLNHSALAVNFSYLIEEQAKHVIYIIEKCEASKISSVEPSSEAEIGWTNEVLKTGQKTLNYHLNCTPSYYNEEGHLNDEAIKKGPYGGGLISFIEILKQWRDDGKMEGLELNFSNKLS